MFYTQNISSIPKTGSCSALFSFFSAPALDFSATLAAASACSNLILACHGDQRMGLGAEKLGFYREKWRKMMVNDG